MFPSFSKATTAEKILLTVKEKPGLKAKQLFFELKKNGFRTSYQNVHKTIKTLKQKSIVKEKDLKYYLSSTWVSKLNQFANFLSSK